MVQQLTLGLHLITKRLDLFMPKKCGALIMITNSHVNINIKNVANGSPGSIRPKLN